MWRPLLTGFRGPKCSQICSCSQSGGGCERTKVYVVCSNNDKESPYVEFVSHEEENDCCLYSGDDEERESWKLLKWSQIPSRKATREWAFMQWKDVFIWFMFPLHPSYHMHAWICHISSFIICNTTFTKTMPLWKLLSFNRSQNRQQIAYARKYPMLNTQSQRPFCVKKYESMKEELMWMRGIYSSIFSSSSSAPPSKSSSSSSSSSSSGPSSSFAFW